MTSKEQFDKGIVSVYDEELDDTIRFSSYEEYESYMVLINLSSKN